MSGTPLEIFPPLTCALNKNGTLEGKEATVYLDAIRKSVKKYGMKTADQLSAAEFMAACTEDVFKISFYRA